MAHHSENKYTSSSSIMMMMFFIICITLLEGISNDKFTNSFHGNSLIDPEHSEHLTMNSDEKCYVPNCITCTENNPFSCSKCARRSECCSKYCKNCSSLDSTVCLQCNEGFTYDSETKICVMDNSCDQDLCFYCPPSPPSPLPQICMVCNSKAAINHFSHVCEICSEGCLRCELYKVCTLCTIGYALVNEKCEKCSNGCEKCTNSSTYCDICKLGYYLTNYHTCLPCADSCATCATKNECLTCKPGYFLNEKKQCAECSPNCQKCLNETFCQQCDQHQPPYILNITSNKCELCEEYYPGCSHCSIEQNLSAIFGVENSPVNSAKYEDSEYLCFLCEKGYQLRPDRKGCIKCTEFCCQCVSEYECRECCVPYIVNASHLCEECKIDKCLICETPTKCRACEVGYYWNELLFPVRISCVKCPMGCAECNVNYCIRCIAGYFLSSSSNECIRCNYPCESCHNNHNCHTCVIGYYQNRFHECLKCHYNCRECLAYNNCLMCVQGYRVDANKEFCIPCQTKNCSFCKLITKVGEEVDNHEKNYTYIDSSHEHEEICFHCLEGTFLNTTNDNSCDQCPKNCIQCSNLTVCHSCQSRYYLSLETNECIKCIEHCKKCQELERTYCVQCDEGYQYDISQNLCIPCKISYCVQCESERCFECSVGYFVTSEKCERCIENCLLCLSADMCNKCEYGFYYSEYTDIKSCLPCHEGCKTCEAVHYHGSGSECMDCHSTYYLDNIGRCLPCEMENCAECFLENPKKCMKCLETYTTHYHQVEPNTSADDEIILSCYKCGEGLLEGCKTCQSFNKCLSCIEDYEVNPKMLCSPESFIEATGLILAVVFLALALVIVLGILVYKKIKRTEIFKNLKKKRENRSSDNSREIITIYESTEGGRELSEKGYSKFEKNYHNHEDYKRID